MNLTSPTATQASADPLQIFGQRYRVVLSAYLEQGSETWLMQASEMARAAVAKGLGLGDVCGLHFAAVQMVGENQPTSPRVATGESALAEGDVGLWHGAAGP